jgi:hypothetical protein
MAGLVFGAGPNSDRPSLTLSDVRVRDADIWFMRADAVRRCSTWSSKTASSVAPNWI